jgi:transposase
VSYPYGTPSFRASKHLASWMGACPGNEESSGVNDSHRCPKGNRQMRRVLNQPANAAVKAKGMDTNERTGRR